MILAALLLSAAAPADPCAWSAPSPPRRMKGVFVNEFEAQRFYEVISVDEIAPRTPFSWLDRNTAEQPATMSPWLRGHVFEVELIGVERFAPTLADDLSAPCAPTNGERSAIRAVGIVSQRDLGVANEILPTRRPRLSR
ncbi:hypothetical protein [uncultured Sphingomonas sp.]|uniref:hypothetical protein n=1 Tax=uncultured Sphingomonas sp. TaxID=158754 RepID=UPI0025F75F11|nr:hypothetical protein [uncultured Sphingomonas sp.]